MVRRRLAGLLVLLGACGSDARTVTIPEVAAGDFEAACADLCTLNAGDTLCTAKHSEFCVTRCRVVTRDLPAGCAECLIAAGTHIEGYTNSFGDSYCSVGGPAELGACETTCDDAGAAPPSAEMETLCQLNCAFYMQDPTPLACSSESSGSCLSECRATATSQGRVCAQCVAEQIIPGRFCINDDCDCANTFPVSTPICPDLCDSV